MPVSEPVIVAKGSLGARRRPLPEHTLRSKGMVIPEKEIRGLLSKGQTD